MRKPLEAIIGMALLYSFLFYKQGAGVNFLIFDVALLPLLYWQLPSKKQLEGWLALAAGCLISALGIVWFHSEVAMATHLLSLFLLAGYQYRAGTSLPVAFVNAMFGLVATLPVNFYYFLIGAEASSIGRRLFRQVLLMIIPLGITLLFFMLYSEGNPVFQAIIPAVDFDFISLPWLIFLCSGVVLISPLFFPMALPWLDKADQHATDALQRKSGRQPALFFTLPFKTTTLKQEYKTGLILLLMLNSLLMLFNGTDVYYLFVVQNLPAGITYSDYLHQSIDTLIVSIFLAIAVILYFFRGNLNFYSRNHFLKVLAYTWIVQNALLLAVAVHKNMLYIDEYGLTHKRIGVFVYLLFTLTGLAFTFIKIRQLQSNWFLFRKTSWIFYFILLTGVFIPWEKCISSYNLQQKGINADIHYLIHELGEDNLPQLLELDRKLPLTQEQREGIGRKKEKFLSNWSKREWLSWNYSSWRLARQLMQNDTGKVSQ